MTTEEKKSTSLFTDEIKMPLIHQVVVAEQSALRSGTKAQKSRSDVRGGGAKPWKQKGTGRARAGTSSSPIWRSGGVSFAATPRSYVQKVNRKMFKGAMRSVLSELKRQHSLLTCQDKDLSLEQPKTKELLQKLATLKVSDVLIVIDVMDDKLFLASRNLYSVGVVEAQQVSVTHLLQYQHVLITDTAISILEKRLA